MFRSLGSALLCGLILFACTTHASAADKKAAGLKVGQKAPEFTAKGIDGKPVKLSSYRGKKAVVAIFIRAHW